MHLENSMSVPFCVPSIPLWFSLEFKQDDDAIIDSDNVKKEKLQTHGLFMLSKVLWKKKTHGLQEIWLLRKKKNTACHTC